MQVTILMRKQSLPLHIEQLIHQLNEAQLHELHYITGDRLNLFHKTKALFDMQKFKVLDRVYFDYHGEQKKGTVMRLNQRTISVTLDSGEYWKVAPNLLIKIIDEDDVGKEKVSDLINNKKKLGRNDPCWCGSGKKYKRCHYPS